MSNLGDFEDPEEEPQGNPVRETRDYAKRLEKRIRELEKANGELTAKVEGYERKERQGTKVAELAKAGLNEKHAKLFLAVNQDDAEVTAEAVQAFITEYGLAAPSNGEGEPGEPEPGFTPVVVAGANGPSPSHKTYKRDEFIALQEKDPAAALVVMREGRVELTTT